MRPVIRVDCSREAEDLEMLHYKRDYKCRSRLVSSLRLVEPGEVIYYDEDVPSAAPGYR